VGQSLEWIKQAIAGGKQLCLLCRAVAEAAIKGGLDDGGIQIGLAGKAEQGKKIH
jgi:hypothetical protein